jgi:hypothetical protein
MYQKGRAGARQRSTLLTQLVLGVYLELQMSSILSHHEDLPAILMMRIITRSLMAAGPPSSRQDFRIHPAKYTVDGVWGVRLGYFALLAA